jgi:nitrogen fixation/metabolism regulation signal transduction histidine kinase
MAWRWLPVGLVFLLLLGALALLNLAAFDQKKAEEVGNWPLYLNGLLLLLLSIVVLVNLARVFYLWRTQQAGSRFTIRLMTGFLVLTLLPVVVVSFFSMNFLGQRIERWFDPEIEKALGDSLQLSELSLRIRSQQHLAELRHLEDNLRGLTRAEIADQLDQFRYEMGAQEVLLLTANQSLEAMSVSGAATLIPHFPTSDLFRALDLRDSFDHLEPVGDDGLFLRVALKVHYGKDMDVGILTALFPLSELERSLSESVEEASSRYKSIEFQRERVADAFRLTLFLIMVLTVLFSLWAAFLFSRRLTQPVRTLVEGTLAVAAGDLDKKLPVSDRDDFSLLARSFNTMTNRLSDARQEREQARRMLQQEHDYLSVVLEHLSSGVMTLDESGIIRRLNTAAGHMLQVAVGDCVGQNLASVCTVAPHLVPFQQAVAHRLGSPEWQEEITLDAQKGRQLLVCRGAALPSDTLGQEGFVLVFDDVTDLIQAEHDAAWGEVARRLAHEIKNPLTPIQLSAERLTRKLAGELSEESASFLKRMTNTIIQQVDNLKSMVNAFSEYARAPGLHLQRVDLNAVVQEVVELYRLNEGQARIRLQLDNTLPGLHLDANRIRQLLVNLVKNALEALEEKQGDGIVILSTHYQEGEAILGIQDNGAGIPAELLPRLFEPYVTTKHKGTGLGLAIVKKIVEEHAGHISARNHEAGGAMISIRFPVDTSTSKEQGT